ncbi:unnamed protein product [Phyllotreta striolata]|uniref:Inter-alpha-trypsin inhibitor heavy chain H3-like n=1 Tax=Phyllotreta striolata TaxID=444603 RepID=A0A9P0DKV3_PHYSR|nr:unnamed protein product [Phyllotreta striolata]
MLKKFLNNSMLLLILILELLNCSEQYELVVLRSTQNVRKSNIVKRQSPQQDVPKIKEFLVNTTVANRFAETTVISKVENMDRYSKQTAFSVVLPESAYISGFFMETDGKMYKAYVKEKKEARRLFANELSTGQTAGHVSVSTRYSNRFTVNVNIEPMSKVTFSLNYEELLKRQNGKYQIVTNIQPGQIVKKLKVEVRIKESTPIVNLSTPYLASGSNALLQLNSDLDPHARIKRSNNSAYILFEPDITRQLNFACAGLGNTEYNGFAGQFIVEYDVDRSNEGGETIYQDGFLVNYFSPKSFDPLPKHVVFILDTSGSMEGLKMQQVIESMEKILPQLHDEDLFNIVQFSAGVYIWDLDSKGNNVLGDEDYTQVNYGNLAEELKNTHITPAHPATKENVQKILNLIKQPWDFHWTNIIGGLEIGLLVIQRAQQQYPDKYVPIIVFLTDGVPTVSSAEEITKQTIALNKASYNTPIYSICYGEDADWQFLKNLSKKSDGRPMKISATADASIFFQNFYSTISNPTLSNLTFGGLPKTAQATQTNFSLFFNGSEQVIAAKGVTGNDTKPITVSARGKDGLVNLESKIGVPLTKLEKIWAYLTIKELFDQYESTGNATLYDLALNRALNYSLVTDFTSLIVVKPGGEDEDPVEPEDAFMGIFPEPPGTLPMCNNITDWIIEHYNTTEPEIDETTEPPYIFDLIEPDFEVTTSTTEVSTTTTEAETEMTTTDIPFIDEDILEYDFGFSLSETTTTTEKIVTCIDSIYGCCYDGVTFSTNPNKDGCDPIPDQESCSLSVDPGPCNNNSIKWVYSTINNRCEMFRYGGCGGNTNRFATRETCENTCVNPVDSKRCKLPISLGNCKMNVLRWFYDKSRDECVKHLHGGCDGNNNRFRSKLECLKTCNPNKWEQTIRDLCYQPKDNGTSSCRRFEKNYYFNSTVGQCIKFWFSGCGGNDNRFTSKNVCEKLCIYSKNKSICQSPPEYGDCYHNYSMYYFDTKTSKCEKFQYSGCGGNQNRFLTLHKCQDFCLHSKAKYS